MPLNNDYECNTLNSPVKMHRSGESSVNKVFACKPTELSSIPSTNTEKQGISGMYL